MFFLNKKNKKDILQNLSAEDKRFTFTILEIPKRELLHWNSILSSIIYFVTVQTVVFTVYFLLLQSFDLTSSTLILQTFSSRFHHLVV